MKATTPLYQQIARDLAQEIASGTYPVGSRLPTEALLCDAYTISRSTAREALRCLVDRGMITRKSRVGSKVIASTPVESYQPVAANAEDLVRLSTGTRIVAAKEECRIAGAGLALRLGCKPDTLLYAYEGARCLRDEGGLPLCWSEQYIPADFPDAARAAMVNGTFSEHSAGKVYVEQVVSATVVQDAMASALGCEPGSPALVITRRHSRADGEFYAAGIHTHPADRYELKLDVTTSPPAREEP